MSSIRPRSAAAYWLAVPAGLWMLAAVVLPTLLILWVSLWGGQSVSPDNPITFDNYARFLSNGSYRALMLDTLAQAAMIMGITGVLGYCIAYFLTVKVTSPAWRTALFLAFVIPFWTSTLIRAIAFVPFLGVNGLLNQALLAAGLIEQPIQAFLYSRLGVSMAQVSLYTLLASGPVVYMLNSIPPALREAAMTLKASPFTVFRRIILPLTLPGIVIGQVLVFLNVLADFITVTTVGGNKLAFLGNLILLFYEGSQIRATAVVSVLLMAVMLAGVAVALRIVDIRKVGG
ncbi:ABC transporter permease [Rhodovarius crocodyli]|uniref:ABC transporter permease n=1 Tax=Rhodovarius crocodyli TaxID=1979269 RepID=A0A437M3I3_9PROT|nr:ABC transporter permease [Rhodovarius crocodyli]RVT92271.1 ABC transporter permease [Rhodovarius crocodyli]